MDAPVITAVKPVNLQYIDNSLHPYSATVNRLPRKYPKS